VRKFLRTLRLDETDPRVFEVAAEAGEWAVSGAFAFAGLTMEGLSGKRKQAFANGFLGLASFGRSTFATVGEADAAAVTAMERALALHLVAAFGAPDEAAATVAAREELAFVEELCRDVPINTVFAVRRVLAETGEIREEFRRIAPPDGMPRHARVWTIEDEAGDPR
jgi:hypothetical protein